MKLMGPLVQPDVHEKKTSFDRVEVTVELL
jgi:hypothetical protein